MYESALAPDEMIVEICFPRVEAGWSFGFEEVSRRHGDFAIAGLANGIQMTDGAIRSARIVFFGIADGPVRARAAEDELTGHSPADPVAQARATDALSDIEVFSSGEYSVEYKRHITGVLLRRALVKHTRQQA
jgi:carbon-monoxide dehydrogenase medium subunit